ncbi:decaprenyl-phosphate phosphoribosyltransferase [candidate division WWE3 bacterium]|jgi:4-hydroxybenzoate polyprenyltransferase|uniref:Decaprenyl-phosphate phosphoribosyltransferase n=1 Tax=candidate division WWE3 bacterium TaxID=2053526 RepID=A0A3A4ZCD9_UNCKA|nr:MAG: decaprenyl-phosphate phosphoribosyltransferase [candidate division WWE3 bacterium]
MINILYQIIRTARPRQWLKNFSLFAAALFSGRILMQSVFFNSVDAFLAFCAISSGAYFINDIIDAPKDRQHPVKKNRPIASGKLPVWIAWVSAIVLIAWSLFFSANNIGSYFTFTLVVYIVMQLSYSLYFRNVIIMDSLVVASGFVIRVFAGGFASNTSISSWLALTTIGISLLLAFGKRRSEKTLVSKYSESNDNATRKTLRHYPDNLLDSMISMAATYTIITYSLFTFQASPQYVSSELSSILPSILRSPKWMMLTIPFVIYGVARYLYIIYEKQEGESPERVLLSDRPLLLTVVLWSLAVFAITYLIPGGIQNG